MSLELRPNCEWCDKDLPPVAEDARICSYECTYCADCVRDVLQELPMEFAVEAQKLLEVSLEGSVG